MFENVYEPVPSVVAEATDAPDVFKSRIVTPGMVPLIVLPEGPAYRSVPEMEEVVGGGGCESIVKMLIVLALSPAYTRLLAMAMALVDPDTPSLSTSIGAVGSETSTSDTPPFGSV